MKYFIFNMHLGNDENYTVVFDYSDVFDRDDLREDLMEFHGEEHNETCRKMLYILPDLDRNVEDIYDSLMDLYKVKKEDISMIFYGENGFISSTESDRTLVEKIQYSGLFYILKKHNAVIEGDDLYHFVLPSKKHSPFFIRTANALQNTSEINFMALCILDELKGADISYIACDTSSILTLGYSYCYLRSKFNTNYHVPVESFGSYRGLEMYTFRPRTLILISASNSGDLEKKIVKKVSEKDLEIVTVVYNNFSDKGRSLININKDFKSFLLYAQSKHFKGSHDDCEYCNRNSIPVLVRGDQFIPSRVIPQKVLIYKRHVPKWIKDLMPLISCSEAVFCFRSENISSKKREIFVDFERLFNCSTEESLSFQKIVKRTIQNLVPASTTTLLYLKDNSSKLIAEKIQEELKFNGKNIGEVIPHTRISELKSQGTEKPYTFVVIAGCLTTGNKLNGVSRELRDFTNSSVHYISILSRLENENKLRVLEQNLTFRSDKSENINVFSSVLSSHLGDYHNHRRVKSFKPPWSSEIEFWDQFEYEEIPESMRKRRDSLQKNEGLVNNLFFKNPFNQKYLALRDNFALYDFEKGDKPSQADIFLITSATFHNMRYPNRKANKTTPVDNYLIQHEHVKSVIDPQIFNRFNDGILQACILRIARPIELSYLTENESLEMSRTIVELFNKPEDIDKNEAILEFLFALTTKKLTLLEDHLNYVVTSLKELYPDNEEISFFLQSILN